MFLLLVSTIISIFIFQFAKRRNKIHDELVQISNDFLMDFYELNAVDQPNGSTSKKMKMLLKNAYKQCIQSTMRAEKKHENISTLYNENLFSKEFFLKSRKTKDDLFEEKMLIEKEIDSFDDEFKLKLQREMQECVLSDVTEEKSCESEMIDRKDYFYQKNLLVDEKVQ